nr:PREDICTED: uncharacterized protein LOC107397722 [Tribolium castaneum]|eukprot:XP_015834361.1 PREDICTED: uncharacterized protein LOC107397722 [Tribolium castaneum]
MLLGVNKSRSPHLPPLKATTGVPNFFPSNILTRSTCPCSWGHSPKSPAPFNPVDNNNACPVNRCQRCRALACIGRSERKTIPTLENNRHRTTHIQCVRAVFVQVF